MAGPSETGAPPCGQAGRGGSIAAMPEKHEKRPCGFGGGVSGT